jgi:ATP-dependent RNA helicase RhlE
MQFNEFGLSAEMLENLRGLRYEEATPIQAGTIPAALTGRDVIGCAQTGTGKTAAFGIPMIERLKGGRHFRGLILAPTRELAMQIADNLVLLSRGTGLRIGAVYGGVPVKRHIQLVRTGPDIIVATPGRLLDLQRQHAIRLDGVEILVLDEADRMLDMGFAKDLNTILRCLRPERQTMLFSATMGNGIQDLVRSGVHEPVTVKIAPHLKTLDQIVQAVKVVHQDDKKQTLIDLLREERGTVLVFTATKHRTERLARTIGNEGFRVARIHGDMLQSQRDRSLASFKSGSARILIATDVASRGLDVVDIAHVVNFDIAKAAEDHIHRIGRTGRAGASGRATTFLTPEDQRELKRDMASALGVSVPAPAPSARRAPAGRLSRPSGRSRFRTGRSSSAKPAFAR